MTDVSARTTRYPEQKEDSSNAQTPDNNDVPIMSLKPNSFLQSSDSLDNNCILNGESVVADFDEDLDQFEGETVARFREELFLSKKPLTETELRAIASAVTSAKFQGEKCHEGVNRYKSNIGYYSEYLDVHKPTYSKDLVEDSVEVPRSGYTGESESIAPSREPRRKSFRKKGITKLISYFETEVSKLESSPENPLDVKSKIFDEVSAVRERESQKRFPKRPGHSKVQSKINTRHQEPYRRAEYLKCGVCRSLDSQDCSQLDNFEPDSLEPIPCSPAVADCQSSKRQDSDCSSCVDGLEVLAKPVKPARANQPRQQARFDRGNTVNNRAFDYCSGSLVRSEATNQKIYLSNDLPSTQQRNVPPIPAERSALTSLSPAIKENLYNLDRLEPVRRSSIISGSTDSSKSPESDSSCEPIPKPLKHSRVNQSRHQSCFNSERGTPGSHDVISSAKAAKSEMAQRTMVHPHPSPAHRKHFPCAGICSFEHCATAGLSSNNHQSTSNPDLINPTSLARNPITRNQGSAGVSQGEKSLVQTPSTHDKAPNLCIDESVNYRAKSRQSSSLASKSVHQKSQPYQFLKSCNSSVASSSNIDPKLDDIVTSAPERAEGMQLDLLSPGDLSDISPSIITPPVGFQNVFPPETLSGQPSARSLQDAELFCHVSVKNLRNKLSPQDEDTAMSRAKW